VSLISDYYHIWTRNPRFYSTHGLVGSTSSPPSQRLIRNNAPASRPSWKAGGGGGTGGDTSKLPSPKRGSLKKGGGGDKEEAGQAQVGRRPLFTPSLTPIFTHFTPSLTPIYTQFNPYLHPV